MKSDSSKKTVDFDGMKYSPELIRQLEDPEYAKAADEYEKQAMQEKKNKHKVSVDYKKSTIGQSGKKAKGKTKGNDKHQKKFKVNKLKLVRNLVLVLLILFGGITAMFFALTGNFDKVDTSDADFAISKKAAEGLSGYRNIAILGVDARADEGYDGSRTDAVIVMSINKKNGDVRLISVMRDSYLKMEYFDGTPILDKLTHAHHYSGGVNTCAAMNQSMDLNIDEFIIFNWKAVADIVDCLGGITINVKENEIKDMNRYGNESAENVGGKYEKITKAGRQKLNGTAAVTYCRIRKTSGGDEGRGTRYKKVVKAVMKKAMLNPTKLIKMSNEIFPNIRTNMSQKELYTMAIGFPVYDFQPSISWPKEYYSGLLSDDVAYVVPQTLESNVKRLHRKAFGQGKYKCSKKCKEISEEIMYDTGIY